MTKLDFKKHYKNLFNPSPKEPSFIEVPPLNYLMIDGEGDPNNSTHFKDAVEKLYSLSYTIKFAIKKINPGDDYTVPPLSGLWWCNNMDEFTIEKKNEWKWTLMIMQPNFTSDGIISSAKKEAESKKGISYDDVRFEKYDEGKAAQILHLGPFSNEKPTIKKLHEFIDANGYKKHLRHHEIYLSDPRKVAPEKFRTIIRQPVCGSK